MKKEIKMPGFTAEASVYKSSGCYYMVGGHGSNTRPVVGPAVYIPLISPKVDGAGSSVGNVGGLTCCCDGDCRTIVCPTDGNVSCSCTSGGVNVGCIGREGQEIEPILFALPELVPNIAKVVDIYFNQKPK